MTTRPGVEDYYAALVRLIANQMVDPHRYFEQKLIGQMQDERDAVAQNARLSQVLQWLDDGLLTPAQRERVDAQLLESGLPSTRVVGRSSDALQSPDTSQ